MVGGNSRLVGWMDGWMNDHSFAIVDAYKASIAIRIMSDMRDEVLVGGKVGAHTRDTKTDRETS